MKKAKAPPVNPRRAAIVQGAGMAADQLDSFIERNALEGFDATPDLWLVIQNNALEDLNAAVEVKGFADKDGAVRYAQALSNGNIDHRVLRVTEQVLVVATMNTL